MAFSRTVILIIYLAITVVLTAVLFGVMFYCLYKRFKGCFNAAAKAEAMTQQYAVVPDHILRDATVEKFLLEMAHEKPIRFTAQQLAGFTRNYSVWLGTGGFGTVYRGALPNGLAVAVKVIHGGLDRRSEEQFMAEVGTIGRTHHINLVRLYGFCFDGAVRALVYEYMDHGALDSYLFGQGRAADVSIATVAAIAVGVAKGLRYLHEECQQKIVHYDIKPGNVLLGGDLTPKVADFGLARLVNHADTHVSMSCVRGTPGFTAPEMWMQSGATEKCDVYSFGMLLFELVGRKRNFDEAAPESQQWLPMLVWQKYESGEMMELAMERHGGHVAAAASAAGGDEPELQCKELVERMCKVAFWCVQQQPEARPPMGMVVKMLEGEMSIVPPVNPFQHLVAAPAVKNLWMTTMTSAAINTVSSLANGVPKPR